MFYTYRISKAEGKTLHSEYMIFLPSESIFPNRPSGVPGYLLRTCFSEWLIYFLRKMFYFFHYEAVHAVFLLNIRKTHLCSGDVLSFEHKLASLL